MKFRPLQDKVLLRRAEEAEKTTGGLFIPQQAREKPQEAKVVAVGHGKVLPDGTVREPEFKAGDTVLIARWAGTEVELDGKKHLILPEDEIMAVLTTAKEA